ncbi:hypothetical protein R4Y45_01755 [Holzapfeliella sp. He02]|uniref:Cell division protein FtsX n=1 Tax=Holzapfeliella saturejae TaxID=3082953 RepID=A0ABU8SF08_9LACO
MATKELKRSKRTTSTAKKVTKTKPKRLTGFLVSDILVIILSVLLMATYLNPNFVKSNLNNSTHMTNYINRQFVKLSNSVTTDQNQLSAKLLNEEQSNDVMNNMIDYTAGIHNFRNNSLQIASEIKTTLINVIDDSSATKAKRVKTALQENEQTSQYAVLGTFDLDGLTTLSNAVTLFWMIAIGVLLIALILLIVILNRMRKSKMTLKLAIKELLSVVSRLGLVLTILFMILAVITSLFDFSGVIGEFAAAIIQYTSYLSFNVVLAGVVMFISASFLSLLTKPLID